MPRFSANLSMLFQELEFADRFEAAASSGFRGVECQFPYDFDKQLLAEHCAEHDLAMVLHNLPAGDWRNGDRGIACHPQRVKEFRDGVGTALEYAEALACSQLNCLAGIVPPEVRPAKARQVLLDNLRFAAEQLRHAGVRLLLEPINTHDVPGFLINGAAQAVEIIDEADCGNLFLQYDAYHMSMMDEDLVAGIGANLHRIAHFQIADAPGRHEPGTGRIDFPLLFQLLDDLGYDGWVGCEYRPAAATGDGLGWMASYL